MAHTRKPSPANQRMQAFTNIVDNGTPNKSGLKQTPSSTSVVSTAEDISSKPVTGWNKGVTHEGTTYYPFTSKEGKITSLKTRSSMGESGTVHDDPSGTYSKVLSDVKFQKTKTYPKD